MKIFHLLLFGLLLIAFGSLQAADKDYVYGGTPKQRKAYPHQIQILKNAEYWVGYDNDYKNPAWVAYRIVGKPKPGVYERKEAFRADPRTSALVSKAKFPVPYDQGHMAASYVMWWAFGDVGMKNSYFMSNMCPQHRSLNRGRWNDLEAMEVEELAQKCGEIWVTVGPIYQGTTKTIEGRGIAIPKAFFKIILDETENGPRTMAFIMPNDKPLAGFTRYLESIDEVERETKLDFFSDLLNAVEQKFETVIPKKIGTIRWSDGR